MPKYRNDSHGRVAISGSELLKLLVRGRGYTVLSVNGDHVVLFDGKHRTTVPISGKREELGQHTLSEILGQTDLTKEQVLSLRKRL